MTFLFALLLGLIAFWHFRFVGSALFPPVLFTGLWAAVLFALALSGDHFYPMSLDGLSLLLLGSVSFGLGGYAVLLLSPAPSESHRPERTYTYRLPISFVLNSGIVIFLASLPSYWARVQKIVAGGEPGDFWVGLRTEISALDGGGLGVFAYLGAFASFLGVLAIYDLKPGATIWVRLRVLVLVVLALVFHLGTGGRTDSLLFFFTITGLGWLKGNRIRLAPALVGGTLAVAIFALVAVLLGKGADRDSSLLDNVRTLAPEIQHYILSGTVAFDRYVRGFVLLAPTPRTLHFPLAVAAFLGSRVAVPELVMPFTDTPNITNVYTMYMPYYEDYGWAGMVVLPFVIGVLATMAYRAARRGVPHGSILYAYFIGGIVLAVAGDQFIMALSHWLQIGGYCIFLFRRNREPVTLPVGGPSGRFQPFPSQLSNRGS